MIYRDRSIVISIMIVDAYTTIPTRQLRAAGVGAILDYAAEADVPEHPPNHKAGVVSARIYDYDGEAVCDQNAKIFLSCIAAAAQRENGFAAVKLTGSHTVLLSPLCAPRNEAD